MPSARTLATVLTAALAAAAAAPSLAGCAGPQRAGAAFPRLDDAPWNPLDPVDWDELADQLRGLPLDDPRRPALRAELAAARAVTVGRLLDDNRPTLAFAALDELAALWADDPARLADELRPQLATIRRARDVFARGGALRESVLALVLLAELEPARAAEHRAELDEVLAYADELAMAEHGPRAARARALTALEPTTLTLPLPALTDRFVALATARQQAVSEALAAGAAGMDLVRGHADVVRAGRTIAAALARAGRADAIAAALAAIQGIGLDEEVAERARAVAAPGADAAAWAALAWAFRGDRRNDDPVTARAVGRAGLARFPGDRELLEVTSAATVALRRTHESIALLEELQRAAPGDGDTADLLAQLYADRLAALALTERPRAARGRLRELDRFHQALRQQFPGRAWSTSFAGALTTLGRGLVSAGALDDAADVLRRAAAQPEAAEACELLATIALARGRWSEAARWADRGLAPPPGVDLAPGVRARLLTIAGDAAAGEGQPEAAFDRRIEALSSWSDVGDDASLPPPRRAEQLLATARLLAALDERPNAVRMADLAIDTAGDDGGAVAQAIVFLLDHGDPRRALDAYHRAVLADGIGDYHKTYMSLWLVADARWHGRPPDPMTLAYLASRNGGLWHDDLARFASGRASLDELTRRARTRGQQAELAYYAATAAPVAAPPARQRALLRRVLDSEVVLFVEYGLARRLLGAAP